MALDADGYCALCGDPADNERLCASCAIDVEMEIDAMLDEARPESD